MGGGEEDDSERWGKAVGSGDERRCVLVDETEGLMRRKCG